MSNALSEMDRELLGEVSYDNEGEVAMAKANGGPGNGAFEGSRGASFTPLNAAAKTLIKISNNGDDLEPGSVSHSIVAHLTPTPPAVFCFLRPQPVSKHPHFVPHMRFPKVSPLPYFLIPSHHPALRQNSLHILLGVPYAVNRISEFLVESSLHHKISLNVFLSPCSLAN